MTNEERQQLENEITKIMRNAVSEEYARCILEQKDEITGNTMMEDIIENVLETSAWEEERYYNEDDIRLAVGRELMARLDVEKEMELYQEKSDGILELKAQNQMMEDSYLNDRYINPILVEVIDYLESWDTKPTTENIKRVLNKWIANLHSHIGEKAHKHSLACGIADETGISQEEQDKNMLEQIAKYEKCLLEIENSLDIGNETDFLYKELFLKKWKEMEELGVVFEKEDGETTFLEKNVFNKFFTSPELLVGFYIWRGAYEIEDGYYLFMEEYDGWIDDCKEIAKQTKEIFEKEISQIKEPPLKETEMDLD